jgi:hypothetical protein
MKVLAVLLISLVCMSEVAAVNLTKAKASNETPIQKLK